MSDDHVERLAETGLRLQAERDEARAENRGLLEDLDVVKARENSALAGYAEHRKELEAEVQRLREELLTAFRVRDEARDEVERLRAANDRLAAERDRRAIAAEAERDRLRAVLAEAAEIVEDTDVVEATGGMNSYYAQLGDARATLKAAAAALRARAGEPTPAPAPDPRPLREIVHAGEPSADGVFFVDLICGHRIATRQRQGEYPCLYCGSGERRRPAP